MTAVLVETNYSNNGIETEDFFELAIITCDSSVGGDKLQQQLNLNGRLFRVAIIAW